MKNYTMYFYSEDVEPVTFCSTCDVDAIGFAVAMAEEYGEEEACFMDFELWSSEFFERRKYIVSYQGGELFRDEHFCCQ